jgi:glycosyltransferase involved in cell wall biosynthesis
MLGKGWFPATLGGLDRYYRSLFEHLPEARGVVIGPATDAPAAIEVVSTHDRPLPMRIFGFWRAAQRAAEDGEIVDAHFALYAAAPLVVGRLRKRPTLFHFQGPWADESVAAGDPSQLKLRMRRQLERLALHRADAHVVLSAAFRRVLVERYGVLPWDVHVSAPGVELERFSPGDRALARERFGVDPGAFVAVCARRLVSRMGIARLLDAWGQLANDLPSGSTLLVVGDGPLREEFERRAAEPVLAGRVRVLGRISDADLVDAYRASDVAVVPSVAFEGYGLVVLEAAACGTPSIVSNVGGLPEATVGLDRSLVVSPNDADALAERLRRAAAGDLPNRETTRYYAERFSWPTVADRHRELHRRVARRERDRRLRVIYVDHVARLSGAEIAMLRLLPATNDRINAHVILGEEGPLVARLQQAGISVEVLPIAETARDVRKDAVHPRGVSPRAAVDAALYVWRLARRLRKLDPDLVHTNSLKAGVYGSLAARLAGIPIIWHVRDRIADDYLPRSATRVLRRLICTLPDAVVANSAATLATVSPSTRRQVSPALHRVIPDAVNHTSPEPINHTVATRFGMVGRITPWKGQHVFLQAFASAFSTEDARAVIVGAPMFGEEAYEQELFDLVRSLGIDDRVEFCGFREDIWQELAGFDVLVHASVTPEPFGQVVIEGMAAGLAVIAADEGGPAATITDGETGRLFRSRDVESLASIMRELADDPDARIRLGAAARTAADAYRPSSVALQLYATYDHVLMTRHDSRRRFRR